MYSVSKWPARGTGAHPPQGRPQLHRKPVSLWKCPSALLAQRDAQLHRTIGHPSANRADELLSSDRVKRRAHGRREKGRAEGRGEPGAPRLGSRPPSHAPGGRRGQVRALT